MSRFDKEYSNKNITVFWKPDVCIHCGNCAHTLPSVFHPAKRPWITLDGATDEQIIRTVEQCPSGALSYGSHDE